MAKARCQLNLGVACCLEKVTATCRDQPKKWTPPPLGWVKMNTDAAFCHNSGAASAGIVVRDNKGRVLLTAWKRMRECGSPEPGEAEACLEGLRLTLEWIRHPTWVEMDCLTIIQDIGRKEDTRSSLAGLLVEVKAVGNLLLGYKFRHTHRASNTVTHLLAKRALEHQACVVMHYNVHTQIKVEATAQTHVLPLCNQREL
jgi:hypothetical protein